MKIPQGMFLFHNMPSPVSELTSEQAAKIQDQRLRRILTTHRAWMSMNLMQRFEPYPEEEAYRVIGRVLSQFADEDCLGVYYLAKNRCVEMTPDVAAGLAGDDPLAVFDYPANVPVIDVAEDDPRMQATVEEAKQRWPEFVHAFTHRLPSQQGFNVKARFEDGETVEYMWVSVTGISGDRISGTLGNDPNALTNIKLGDEVTLSPDDVADWLYLDGEEMVGGFSIKVLQEIMAAR